VPKNRGFILNAITCKPAISTIQWLVWIDLQEEPCKLIFSAQFPFSFSSYCAKAMTERVAVGLMLASSESAITFRGYTSFVLSREEWPRDQMIIEADLVHGRKRVPHQTPQPFSYLLVSLYLPSLQQVLTHCPPHLGMMNVAFKLFICTQGVDPKPATLKEWG